VNDEVILLSGPWRGRIEASNPVRRFGTIAKKDYLGRSTAPTKNKGERGKTNEQPGVS
jgi:hypothetical protein